jgi:CDP-2,3-bis-(O-geranylgeranyl)-sn-glycerol synthase
MHPAAVTQVLILVTLANGAPVVAKNILGDRYAWPLDFGIELPDGHPLFGRSKTIRGVLLGVLFSSAGAPFIGLGVPLGAEVGILAMAGDVLSSFLKRRMSREPSSRAIGLDQIPETLLALLPCVKPLDLTIIDIAAVVVIFLVGELLVSRVLFRMHLRDRPY